MIQVVRSFDVHVLVTMMGNLFEIIIDYRFVTVSHKPINNQLNNRFLVKCNLDIKFAVILFSVIFFGYGIFTQNFKVVINQGTDMIISFSIEKRENV